MTRDELAALLCDSTEGPGTFALYSEHTKERYRKYAANVIERLHAEHYAPVERVLDEIDGGPSGEGCDIVDRVRAIGEHLVDARRDAIAATRAQPAPEVLLNEVRSALNELDGGALGTLVDRVRAIPGLVRARALRANAEKSIDGERNRLDRLEAIAAYLWDASRGFHVCDDDLDVVRSLVQKMRATK